MRGKNNMTNYSEEFRQKYGWGGGWDALRQTENCLHCHGTGIAPGDGKTECGFCYTDKKKEK